MVALPRNRSLPKKERVCPKSPCGGMAVIILCVLIVCWLDKPFKFSAFPDSYNRIAESRASFVAEDVTIFDDTINHHDIVRSLLPNALRLVESRLRSFPCSYFFWDRIVRLHAGEILSLREPIKQSEIATDFINKSGSFPEISENNIHVDTSAYIAVKGLPKQPIKVYFEHHPCALTSDESVSTILGRPGANCRGARQRCKRSNLLFGLGDHLFCLILGVLHFSDLIAGRFDEFVGLLSGFQHFLELLCERDNCLSW